MIKKRRAFYVLVIGIVVFLSIFFFLKETYNNSFSLKPKEHYITIKDNSINYLGYSLYWNGLIKPIIQDISVYQNETFENRNNESIKFFIDEESALVSLNEDAYKVSEQKKLVHLIDYKDFHVKSSKFSTTLVIRINTKYKSELSKIKQIRIRYKLLFFEKEQVLDISFSS